MDIAGHVKAGARRHTSEMGNDREGSDEHRRDLACNSELSSLRLFLATPLPSNEIKSA
jgi:hypothetical protein